MKGQGVLSAFSDVTTQNAIEGNEIALTAVNFKSRCKGQQLIDKW